MMPTASQKSKSRPKPKLSKEDRRAKYTELARQRASKDRERSVGRKSICFQCRQRGHTVANCPNSTVANCCYKCGSTEHTLGNCPKRSRRGDSSSGDGGNLLPFATCFVCNESGHLASQCPHNAKGIYINGGSCKVCGSTQHRGTECPERKAKESKPRADEKGGSGAVSDDEYSDLLDDGEQPKATAAARSPPEARTTDGAATRDTAKRKRRVVNF
jgi:zinc finger CCHC domain-containing protein 9